MSGRARRFRSPFTVIAALWTFSILSGCSSDGDSNESFEKAVEEVTSSSQPAIAGWTRTIADRAAQEIQASGVYDEVSLTSKSKLDSAGASEAICAAIKKNPAIYKSEGQSPTGEQRIAGFVDREMVAALGRHPMVLYAEKVVWPKSWLLDPAKPPTYDLLPKDADPQFLRAVLNARFVASDGTFSAPEQGSSDYPTLISWLRQSSNTFAGTVGSLTSPVYSAISDCVTQQRVSK